MNDTLINTFQMICERLSNIEHSLYTLTEREKDKELQRIGKIDKRLFGWDVDVVRFPDIVNKINVEDGTVKVSCQPQKQGSCHISQARVCIHECEGLPTWYKAKLEQENFDKPDDLFAGLDIEQLKKIELERHSGATCKEVGLESDYEYAVDEIAQRVAERHLQTSQKFAGLRYDNEGAWIWTRSGQAASLPDWVEFVVKLYEKLGYDPKSKTLSIYPLSRRSAEIGSMVSTALSTEAKQKFKNSAEAEQFRTNLQVDPPYIKSHAALDDVADAMIDFLGWKQQMMTDDEQEEAFEQDVDQEYDEDYDAEYDEGYEDEHDDLF